MGLLNGEAFSELKQEFAGLRGLDVSDFDGS